MRPLTPAEADFLAAARTAVLATIDPAGRPRLVPICFVALGGVEPDLPVLYTPLDDKPKRVPDPHALGRVRDIAARPEVSVLVQRWDEDWRQLAWLRLHGRAELVESGDAGAATERASAIDALRAKYPQYDDHDLESRPIIRIELDSSVAWGQGDDPEPRAGPHDA
jgi:PPOX class probable F420-dependent enzyme